MNKKEVISPKIGFLAEVCKIVAQGRSVAYKSVNQAMIVTYWHLGKRIVEEEQRGEQRAEYGT